MKKHIYVFSVVLVVITCIASCKKDTPAATVSPADPPADNLLNTTTGDYFGSGYWFTTARAQEMHFVSNQITQAALDKGFNVYVSVDGADLFPWVLLPATVYEVQLEYKIEPGHLYVYAKAPYTLVNQSDVWIDFK